MRRKLGQQDGRGQRIQGWGSGWDRRYFCPLMDCDIDRGGIMSNRYSRCRSARLGALCPPMPVFKYAMLTPRPGRQKWGQVLKEEAMPPARPGLQIGRREGTSAAAPFCADSVKLGASATTLCPQASRKEVLRRWHSRD